VATVVAGLPPTATPKPGERPLFVGITEIGALSLGADSSGRPLWAIFSTGTRSFNPIQSHFVAVYVRTDRGWQQLSRVELDDADFVFPQAVTRVALEPSHTWLEVESGAGAHGGCFDLLSFDGARLHHEVSYCHSSPGAGDLADLNGDGALEVVLDRSENYVFCYACGVRLPSYQVLRWDGAQLVEVDLTPLPEPAPTDVRRLTNRAVELAQAGLWKDARTTIAQAQALQPKDPTVGWDAALIRLHADAREEQARSGPYPLLGNVFFGDYAAALDVVRPYTPAQLFDPDGPLVVGTVAEQWLPQLVEAVETTATAALKAQPDLAAAYFLRGWAAYLNQPGSSEALADLQRAATLAPSEPLFARSLQYVKTRG
jgi:hypothetical protein